MRVLIAEDDPIFRKMLEGLLTAWGDHAVTATDGAQAWRILQEHEAPKLAILDWTMPGLDGVEVCRRLRLRQTPTPTYVILVTARAAKADIVAGLEAGANDYVAKPFDPDELRARVQVGRAVIELQQSVAQRMREFEGYVENCPLGMLALESNGCISFANGRAHSIFRYEPGELLGQPIEILVPESIRGRHAELRSGYLESPHYRTLANRELYGQRKDNSQVSVAVGLNPIHRGTTAQVMATVMDHTELRKAESQFEHFFDLSLDLFCIAHVNGAILRVNASYRRLLGFSNEELLSRPFYHIIHPEDVPAVEAQVQRLAAGEAVVEFRCRLRDRGGGDHWIEWNVQPADGTLYVVGRNITEHLRLENDLLYRERRERAILDNTPAIIYIKGADGRFEFVNRRHAELFSGSEASAAGKRARDFFPEEDAARFDQQDQHVRETGETVTVRETVRQDDGEHEYVIVRFPLLDPAGRVCATAGIWTDITEQLRARETEQELALARTFQRRLYPRTAPTIVGLDVAGSALPLTQMCGDYFDYIQLGPKRLLAIIGDVSGHGVGPALQMTEVRCTVRILAQQGNSLPSIMGELNRMLCADLPDNVFVSFFMADIDVENHRLQYLGAGHDAMLIRADGAEHNLDSTHLLLGIEPAVDFLEVASAGIDKGDTLFLFTDGLNETCDVGGQDFGRQRAARVVRRYRQEPSDRIIQELFASVLEFADGRHLKDDITVVVAKVAE